MLQAMRDEVIVRPIYETKTKSGLIIPEGAGQYKLYHGSIYGYAISIGPDFPKMFKSLKPGDKVIWRRHEGRKVYENRELYFTIKSRWIMGKVIEEPKMYGNGVIENHLGEMRKADKLLNKIIDNRTLGRG